MEAKRVCTYLDKLEQELQAKHDTCQPAMQNYQKEIKTAQRELDRIQSEYLPIRDNLEVLKNLQKGPVLIPESRVFDELWEDGVDCYDENNMVQRTDIDIDIKVAFTLGGYKWREVTDAELASNWREALEEKSKAECPPSTIILCEADDLELDCCKYSDDKVDIDLSEAGNGVFHTEANTFTFVLLQLKK